MGFRTWFYKTTGIKLKKDLKENLDFSQFESLGDNCEFGLFLFKSGNNYSSFFRYMGIANYKSVNNLILNNFNDVFLFENLFPTSPIMVCDKKYGLNIHTLIRNHQKDGKWEYNHSKEDLIKLYENELGKINYLSTKFLNDLKYKNKTYIIKENENKPGKADDLIEETLELRKTLFSKGKCNILYVMCTDDPNKQYKVEKLESNVFIGYMDRFAPYSNAHDYNFDGWKKLIKAAKKKIYFSGIIGFLKKI